ncbi:MAG: tetratricopeptide repeat protein [Candidatus Omnitrophota bacterium]
MKQITVLLVFLAAALALYVFALPGEFVFDDYKVLVQNQFIRTVFPLSFLWKFDPTRFLTNLTFAVNYQVSGLAPWVFRLINVILHALSAYVFFAVCRRFLARKLVADERKRLWLPWIAGFIFLLHPIQTSTVSYVVQRATILSALFYLTAVYFYLSSRSHPQQLRPWHYTLSVIAGLLGTMAKPTILSLPLMILLLEAFLVRDKSRPLWNRVLAVLPFFAVPVMLGLHVLFLKEGGVGFYSIAGLTRQTAAISRPEYFMTQFSVIVFYIGLLLFPLSQRLDYDFPLVTEILSPQLLISVIAIAALLYLAVRSRRRRPLVTLGIFWFFITLLPESSIFPLDDLIFEHRLYLPLAGFALAVSAFVLSVKKRTAAFAVLAVLAVFWTGKAVYRNVLWGKTERLLIDTVRKSPTSLRVYYNLSSYYRRHDRLAEASRILQKAFNVSPQHPATEYKLGILAEEQGEEEKAIRHYAQALVPELPLIASDAAWRAGYLSQRIDQTAQAKSFFEAAIEIYPRHSAAHVDLANIYNLEGNAQRAEELYEQAVIADPHNMNAYNGLASVLALQQRYEQSIDIYQRGLQVDPDNELLRLNLAKVYYLTKEFKQAAEQFSQVVEREPDNTEARYYLGMSYLALKNSSAAEKVFRDLLAYLKEAGREEEAAQIQERFFKVNYNIVPAQDSGQQDRSSASDEEGSSP